MRKMKKTVTTVVAIGMMLALTACGGGNSSETPGQDTAEEEASEETAAEAPTETTPSVGFPDAGNFQDDDGNYFILFHMTEEGGYDHDSWSATVISPDGEMVGGEMEEQADGTLSGMFTALTDDGEVVELGTTTITQEGSNVRVQMADGTEYYFYPDETDYSDMEIGNALPFFSFAEISGYENIDPAENAVYDYLAFEKERDYDPDHAMIPYAKVIAVEDEDAADTLIYGDYWLYEFEQQEDTLVVVSGGHCPGIIHAERFGEGEMAIYDGLSMEEALTDDEAESLFGTYYNQYVALSSDDVTRDAEFAQILANYVNVNELDVTKYQMSEGDVRELP